MSCVPARLERSPTDRNGTEVEACRRAEDIVNEAINATVGLKR